MSIRRHITYANVAATLAVLIALTGTSYAAVKITGKDVKNSSLTGKDVKDSSLTGGDVKNGSLVSGDFKPGQLPSGSPGASGAPGADGQDGNVGEPGPGAIKLDLVAANGGQPFQSLGALGGVSVACNGGGGSRAMHLIIHGPVGSGLQLSSTTSRDDVTPVVSHFGTNNHPSGVGALRIGRPYTIDADTVGHYFRGTGTLVLHSSTDVMTIVFDMFLEDREGAGICHLRGTATPST